MTGRPAEWGATEHVIADMYEAGLTFEQIREALREGARQAAEIIIAESRRKDAEQP